MKTDNIDIKLLKKIAYFLLENKSRAFLEEKGITWRQKQITGLNKDSALVAITEIYQGLTGRKLVGISKTDIQQSPSGKMTNITGKKIRFDQLPSGTSTYTIVSFEYLQDGKTQIENLPKQFNYSCKGAVKTK